MQLSNFTNEHTYQDKTVTVPAPFQLDDQMRVRFTVKATSTVTITLYCGAVANMGKFLEKRVSKANHTKKMMPKSYNPLAIKDRVTIGAAAVLAVVVLVSFKS